MLRTCLLLVAIAITICTLAQKPSVAWSDEFKVKKGAGNNIKVLTTDSSGVYLEEMGWSLKSYYVIGASMRTAAMLVKLDKDLQELYRIDFATALNGKEFEYFFAFKDKLLIIASTYNSDRELDIFAAEVDKLSGRIIGSWKPIANFQKENNKQEINFKLTPNADTSGFVVISSVTDKETNTFQVQEFDRNLKATSQPVTISNEFEVKTYQLQDVLYTTDRMIILVGRVFEYQEVKNKKERLLHFSNYNIRIYNEKGKQENEINTNINGKWIINTKLLLKGKELVLACFYSKEKRGATNGLLVQRIDPKTGKVISTAEKEMNYSLLTAESDDTRDGDDKDENGNDSRIEKKGYSEYMRFRNIFYTADGGLVLLAENFNEYTKTTTVWRPGKNGGPDISKDYNYDVYESGEIMICKIDAPGTISWMQILPKVQREFFRTYNGGGTGVSLTSGFFDLSFRPFYSGFNAMQTNNKLNIFFNDNPKNAKVLQSGKGVFHATELGDSHCFVVTLDEVTGKYKRKDLFSNSKVPTAMLSHGAVFGHDMFIIGKTESSNGKTKLAVARISLK